MNCFSLGVYVNEYPGFKWWIEDVAFSKIVQLKLNGQDKRLTLIAFKKSRGLLMNEMILSLFVGGNFINHSLKFDNR